MHDFKDSRFNGNSLILIGMPGAGKSTLGVLLAKEVGKDFVDTDVAIQVREGKTLQEIVDQDGYLALRRIEEAVLLESYFPNHVVATGGSVVYCEKGMAHIKKFGPVVFLDVSVEELKSRIHNYESRGIARRPEQSFAELFQERQKLYRHYGDIIVDCNGKRMEQIIEKILEALGTQR